MTLKIRDHECNEVLLPPAAGEFDGLAARCVELIERDTGAMGWRFDTPPLLWPISMEAALATGDFNVAERLIEMLDGLQPGHRPPYLSAELVHAPLASPSPAATPMLTSKPTCATPSTDSPPLASRCPRRPPVSTFGTGCTPTGEMPRPSRWPSPPWALPRPSAPSPCSHASMPRPSSPRSKRPRELVGQCVSRGGRVT